MKPNFALTLSEESIGLLHRAKGGWQRLGEVALDDPGLAKTLALMRRTAEALDGEVLATKLVIPDSQVLYTTLPLAGQSPKEQRAGLRRGLEGLTPYSVEEILFDWRPEGDSARLAVVARETLDEAEDFARAHGFNPVCFVAAPGPAQFDGEPFFGATALAAELLGPGTRPEPDDRALHTGHGADEARGSADRLKAPPRRPAKSAPARSPMAVPGPSAARPADAPPDAMGLVDAPVPDDETARAGAARDDTALPAPSDRPDGTGEAAAFASRRHAGDERPEPSARSSSATDDASSPTLTEAGAGGVGGRASPAEAPPPLAGSAPPGADRTTAQPGTEGAAASAAPMEAMPAAARDSRAAPEPRPFRSHHLETPLDRGEPDPPAPPRPQRKAAPRPRRKPTIRGALVLAAGLLAAMGAVALWSMMAGDDAPQIAGQPETTAPAQSDLADAGASEDGQAATGPWHEALKAPESPVQDRIDDLYIATLDPSIRPPLGVSLPDPRRALQSDPPLPRQSDPLGPDRILARDTTLVPPTPQGTVTPDGLTIFAGQPERTPPDRPEDSAALRPEDDPQMAAPPIPIEVREGAPAVTPPARPAGLAPAPPANGPAETQTAPTAQADETGNATDIDVTVRQGRPAAVPPPRPADAAPTPATGDGAEADTGSDTGADSVAVAEIQPSAEPQGPDAAAARDPRLPETAILASDPEIAARLAPFRPRIRPADLIPAALPVPEPQAAAEPTMRPRSRPGDLAPEAETSTAGRAAGNGEDVAAAVAEALEGADEEPEPQEPLSELAIEASIRPAARPSDFGDRVISNAPAVPPTAAATPPRVPTSASVAKQATVRNAINLGEVNLIGVYGSPSDRRALVRLPTGRYLKVKVGDRIDGGQVAAIGDDTLRYVKNGRNVVLDVPGG